MSAGVVKGPDWHSELDLYKMQMLNACRSGDYATVREMIEKKEVDVDEADDDGMTALQIASACGHLNLVKSLVSDLQAEIDLANELGYTPFLHACREGHLLVVKYLKQNGADEKRKTAFNMSALGLASAGGHLEVMKFLSSLEVDMIPREEDLTPSPLMAAAARSHVHAVKFLASRGGNVNYSSRGLGLTPLHLAVICGNAEVIHALVLLNAPLEKLTFKNKKADKIALYADNKVAQRYIERFRRNKRLPEKPPKVHVSDIILKCDPDELRSLRRQYFNSPQPEVTPLMYAVLLGKLEAVQHLCEVHNDNHQLTVTSIHDLKKSPSDAVLSFINLCEPQLGMTALMMAIVLRDFEMVCVLVHAGADLTVEAQWNDRQFTAFDLAFKSGFREALQLMIFHEHCGTEKRREFNRSFGREQKSTPKELLNKLMCRLGLVDEDEMENENRITSLRKNHRIVFESLLECSTTDWSKPQPFLTASQLMKPDCLPARTVHVSTADDRVELLRNMTKVIIERPGYLKPFPVGLPLDGNFKPFEKSPSSWFTSSFGNSNQSGLMCINRESNGALSETESRADDAIQNYQRMKQMNSKGKQSELKRRETYSHSRTSELAEPQRQFLLNNMRPRRSSMTANPRHSIQQMRHPFSNSSDPPTVYAYSTDYRRLSNTDSSLPHTASAPPPLNISNASMAYADLNEQIRYKHNNSPLFYTGSGNSPIGSLSGRSQLTYYPSVSTGSPAMNQWKLGQRSTTNLSTYTVNRSPNTPTKLRHRVRPHQIPNVYFEATETVSAPATPPSTSSVPQIVLPTTPRSRKSSALTLDKIRCCLDAIGMSTYFSLFLQQEIDPTIFINLTKEDVQTIVSDLFAAEKIYAVVVQLNQIYG
ncbi:ANK-REP-REGION domain-containing protein [Aphelenchoides besseyi]|nr:ANK-REP-REGION domain-containing protein [Aphelenchoides besseyi]KAI6208809.1 ANK-REP-REGION domain-containing protein [Aphelenchoides besseyi]